MKEFKIGTTCHGFRLMAKEEISDIRSVGHIFRHEKTGAQLLYIQNEDKNKVFFIAFKTPPENSFGTAHILEHSVLCGSAKYPVREPFIELAKGSINTYLNALTYPDKTMYPVASTNSRDFRNLKAVYLDAVFAPLIYERKEIFLQEGWNLKLSEEGLRFSGVVYNEMKGAYSDPDDMLGNAINRGLFKESPYRFDSGGAPEEIPSLTYEEFLDFHKKYYHPSNSFIYFYGDMDMERELKDLDWEYLSRYERAAPCGDISPEPAPAQRGFVRESYPVSPDDDMECGNMYAYSNIAGKSTDSFLRFSLGVLSYVLMGNNGSPVKNALLDAGLCRDAYCWFEADTLDMVFSIIGKKCPKDREEEFYGKVKSSLLELSRKGIDKELIKSAINAFLFYAREEDFGGRPKGLKYGMTAMSPWLHGGNPFAALRDKSAYGKLLELADTDYFEKLIKEYLLDNPREALVVLYPNKEKEKEREKLLRDKLESIRAKLSAEDMESLKAENASLAEFQNRKDKKEDLEKIPMLRLSDIEKSAQYAGYEALPGLPGIFVPLETQGIVYTELMFDISGLGEEKIPWAGLLAEVLGRMATESHSFETLPAQIDRHTGGIDFNLRVYSRGAKDCHTHFSCSGKAFSEKTDKLYELMGEILFTTDFSDKTALKKIIDELMSDLERNLLVNGHLAAIRRAASRISRGEAVGESARGVRFFRFLKTAAADLDTAVRMLSETAAGILNRNTLTVCIGAGKGEKELLIPGAREIFWKLESVMGEKTSGGFEPSAVAEALKSQSKVMYNAVAADFAARGFKYSGKMKVAKAVVDLEYLWNNVRVKGGAYGCGCGLRRDGIIYAYSFRDPRVKPTLDALRSAGGFLRGFSADERELAKYIIGTISDMDQPLTNRRRLDEAIKNRVLSISREDARREREEVLSATLGDIREMGRVFDILAEGSVCVTGGEAEIERCGEIFDVIDTLL